MHVRSQLGHTTYEMNDSSPGMVRIVRTNADRTTTVFVPEELLLKWFERRCGDSFFSFMRAVLAERQSAARMATDKEPTG